MTTHDLHTDTLTEPRRIFAANLRLAMARKGVTINGLRRQVTTAAGLHVDQRVVKGWRSGEAMPKPEALWQIADALDVTPGWFFDNDHTAETADDEPVAA